jgi:Na+/H+ antiporter NhaD/arsenite permease-like protein
MIQQTQSKQKEQRVESVRVAALSQKNQITAVIILLAFKIESIFPMPLNLLGNLERTFALLVKHLKHKELLRVNDVASGLMYLFKIDISQFNDKM